jgi:hypothetical protein
VGFDVKLQHVEVQHVEVQHVGVQPCEAEAHKAALSDGHIPTILDCCDYKSERASVKLSITRTQIAIQLRL